MALVFAVLSVAPASALAQEPPSGSEPGAATCAGAEPCPSEAEPPTEPDADTAPTETPTPPPSAAFESQPAAAPPPASVPSAQPDEKASAPGARSSVAPSVLDDEMMDAPAERGGDTGGARAASIVGFVFGGASLALSAGSFIADERDVARGLGGAALGAAAIATPVAALGGYMARANREIEGPPLLRVFSWIAYVGCIATGVSLIVAEEAGATIEAETILPVGLLGAAAAVLMGVDGMVSASRADDADAAWAKRHSTDGVAFAPFVSVTPGRSAPWTVGLAGAF